VVAVAGAAVAGATKARRGFSAPAQAPKT
jgi:hypothetical protein